MKQIKIVMAVFLLVVHIFPFIAKASAQQPQLTQIPLESVGMQVYNWAYNNSPSVAEKVYEVYDPPDNQIKIVISAVGDCTLGQDDSRGIYGSFDAEFIKQKKDYKYFFSGVKEILGQDDLTIANLETTLTTASVRAEKEFTFRGRPQFVNILKEGSIEAVNIANNHSRDFLQKGFDDTIQNLKNANIGYFGFGYTYIAEIKGIRVGMLGYTGGTASKYIIKKDLDSMKNNADLVVVSFHWGTERADYPSARQREMGRYAIDQGAALVLGHHPHVVQGIENYKGKNIVYSLANFCFGGNRNPSDKDTFIYQQTFVFDQQHKLVSAGDKNIIPCSVSSVKNRNDYHPVILTGTEKTRVLDRINSLTPGDELPND